MKPPAPVLLSNCIKSPDHRTLFPRPILILRKDSQLGTPPSPVLQSYTMFKKWVHHNHGLHPLLNVLCLRTSSKVDETRSHNTRPTASMNHGSSGAQSKHDGAKPTSLTPPSPPGLEHPDSARRQKDREAYEAWLALKPPVAGAQDHLPVASTSPESHDRPMERQSPGMPRSKDRPYSHKGVRVVVVVCTFIEGCVFVFFRHGACV